ncbi:hypothetical protein BGZ58_003339, partial [Dissophora ornata]
MTKHLLDDEGSAVLQEEYQEEYQEDIRPKKHVVRDDEDEASTLIAAELFGDRPTTLQWSAVVYAVEMRLAPAPTVSNYLAHMQGQRPEVPKPALAKIWRRYKEFFVAANQEHVKLKELVNMPDMVAAFEAAPFIETGPAAPHEDGTTTTQPSAPPPPPYIPTTTRSSRSSKSKASRSSGNSSNSGSSGSDSGSLSSVALAKMKYHFDTNFAAYQGTPWRLPSGAIVDDVVAQLARQDGFESALQSFVLEDPNKVIALFPNQEDKDELYKVLVDRSGETLASLTAQKEAFVEQFGKTPQEVKKLLGQGWANLQEGTELDEDYKMLVHHCFQQLYLAYRHFHFSLPKDMKEAYYTDKIWGFMNVALDDVEMLDHKPGEINRKSSGLRKNKDMTRQNRQAQGRKTDGLVLTKGASHELCIVEAARKEHGPNGTKALDDTLKLAKGMKDMMDNIRASASENIRNHLVTYGIRISATTMTMYTLRQRPGRCYQLISHTPISLPTTWNAITGKRIANVVSKLLAFKEDIMTMSAIADEWTNQPVEDNGDRWVRTLLTPTNSPFQAP